MIAMGLLKCLAVSKQNQQPHFLGSTPPTERLLKLREYLSFSTLLLGRYSSTSSYPTVLNILITFSPFLALIYVKGIEYLFASACPSLAWTTLSSGRSVLLATSIFTTSLGACSVICCIHRSEYHTVVHTFQKERSQLIEQTSKMPAAPLQQAWVTFLNLYWPAVSQICSFILLPLTVMVFILKSTPMVATQFCLNLFSQNLKRILVLPTPQSPTIIIFSTSSSFFACILLQQQMYSLKAKRQAYAQSMRQRDREDIRRTHREDMLNHMKWHEYPLISSTFSMFWDLTYQQLCGQSDKIMDVLCNTNLQELGDQDHDELVTDLFYLVHQKVLREPFFVKFKKNEDLNTACLAAYLSEQIQAQQLAYWIKFMDDQSKRLVFSTIEGQSQSHLKWISSAKLYTFLLENLKDFQEANQAFKSILVSSEEISKKQVDQSVLYLQKAITSSVNQQKQYLRGALIINWMKIMQIYMRIKESSGKIEFMVTVLAHQLSQRVYLFLNSQILSDLNQFYEREPLPYVQGQKLCEAIVELVCDKCEDSPSQIEEDHRYYLNCLFRLFFNIWQSRKKGNPDYTFSQKVYGRLQKLSTLEVRNAWVYKMLKGLR